MAPVSARAWTRREAPPTLRKFDTALVTAAQVAVLAVGAWLEDPWWLIAVALSIVVAIGGVEWLLRGAIPGEEPTPWLDRLTFYPLPACLSLAFLVVARNPILDQSLWPTALIRALVVVGAGAVMFFGVSAQRDSYTARPAPTSSTRFVMLVLVIVAAFVLFGTIQAAKPYLGGLAPLGIGLLAGFFGLEVFRTKPEEWASTYRLAALTGFLISQCGVAVELIGLDPIRGGAFLILVFYVLTGLTQYASARAVTRALVLEYVGIGAVGLLFILANAAS